MSRFQFPGFVPIYKDGEKDTPTHEVEVGTVRAGKQSVVVELIRKKGNERFSFLAASIRTREEYPLWHFRGEDFDGLGFLAMAGEVPVVALVGAKSRGVERVIPLDTLGVAAPQFGIGAVRDLAEMLLLKQEAAKYIRCVPVLSDEEKLFVQMHTEERRKEEELHAQARRDERLRRREELERQVRSRGLFDITTTSGRKRRVFTVLEEEWASMPKDTWCGRVEHIGGPIIESFQVMKEAGRNPSKRFCEACMTTSALESKQKTAELPKPLRTGLVSVVGEDGKRKVHAVSIYRTKEDVDVLRKAGLNGGTLVSYGSPLPNGRFPVYAVHTDRIDTIGNFEVLLSGRK